ncbi:MAG: hypothetical protein ACJ73D_07105 [Pyrinomonadaceae bacterium]
MLACSLLGGCSIPSLESGQCTDARNTLREFYSRYFGTDASVRRNEPQVIGKYLSPAFNLTEREEGYAPAVDPFTLSTEFPKTFKVGTCQADTINHAIIQVQLYWQEEHGSTKETTQREVSVDVIKSEDGRWLIDNVAEARTK